MIAILLVALAFMGVIIYYMMKTGKTDPAKKSQPRPRPESRPAPAAATPSEVEPPIEFEAPQQRASAAPADGFEDLDTPAGVAATGSADNGDEEFVFVSTSPLTREFYADLRNIERIPEPQRINILRTAIEYNIITKESYEELLNLNADGSEDGKEGSAPDFPTESPEEEPRPVYNPPAAYHPAQQRTHRPDKEELQRRWLRPDEPRRDDAAQPQPSEPAPKPAQTTPPPPAPKPEPGPVPQDDGDIFDSPAIQEAHPVSAKPSAAVDPYDPMKRQKDARGRFTKSAPTPAPAPSAAELFPAPEPLSDFDSDDWGDF